MDLKPIFPTKEGIEDDIKKTALSNTYKTMTTDVPNKILLERFFSGFSILPAIYALAFQPL